MATDIKTRIEERNRLAEWHSRDKHPVSRAVSKVGLMAANAWDRVAAPFTNDGTALAEGAAFGVTKGAVVGGLLGITAALVVGAAVPLYCMIAATGGALLKGYQYGHYAVDENSAQSQHRTADTIAEVTGAVPSPKKLLSQEVREPRRPLPATPPAVEDTSSYTPSFVEQEKRRRAAGRGPTVLH